MLKLEAKINTIRNSTRRTEKTNSPRPLKKPMNGIVKSAFYSLCFKNICINKSMDLGQPINRYQKVIIFSTT